MKKRNEKNPSLPFYSFPFQSLDVCSDVWVCVMLKRSVKRTRESFKREIKDERTISECATSNLFKVLLIAFLFIRPANVNRIVTPHLTSCIAQFSMKPSKWFSKKIYEAIPFYGANKIKLINFAFLLQSFRIALISGLKKMAKNQHTHTTKRKRMGEKVAASILMLLPLQQATKSACNNQN